MVLVAVARTKKLQTVTNVFVVNLSVTDCLSSFAFLWSVLGMASTTPGYLLQSDVPCVTAAGAVFTAVGCSLYTLASIALNRYILITRSRETFQWLYTPKKITLMVSGSWLVPVCAIVMPPVFGVGDLGFDPESRTCSDVDTHPMADAYDKVQFWVLYPLPLVVIVVSYVLIWRYMKQHFSKRRQKGVSQQVSTLKADYSSTSKLDIDDNRHAGGFVKSVASSQNTGSSRHLSRIKKDQLTITKNLFVVVLTFLVCFTPIAIMVVTKSNRYMLYGALTMFLSSGINPFIYAAKHPHFKPVLRSMVWCRCSTETMA
ncbi:G-protein coupled receptor moody-like [Acanthaster planci]|uniref:G-protein coupled receptor moody-like n=1 Tax=Acanthaster planci TaxID=133434 RepID=A0A8B7XID9_ACAPL|nr:G-protein coupled receptor moody-like [Acanthaster planci]